MHCQFPVGLGLCCVSPARQVHRCVFDDLCRLANATVSSFGDQQQEIAIDYAFGREEIAQACAKMIQSYEAQQKN